MSGKIYVATETFASAHDPNTILKGVTRVREGHILLQHHPMFFVPLGEERPLDHEYATRGPSSPTQVRPEAPATPVGEDEPEVVDAPALEDMTRTALEEIAEQAGVENPASYPNKAALIAAIRAA